MVQLVCQDTAAPIPDVERDSIFDVGRARDLESLGLSIAASVAKAHGGKISVRSQEGAGNAFLMELPMTSAASAPESIPDLRGKKVLVVDDEEFLLECMVDAITSWGCEVTPTGLAKDAIEKLQAGSYDLIVSDVRMPGLSGFEFFDWIRNNQPHMTNRILFTTGDSFDPETRSFLERGSLPHLGKPFDLKKFKKALGDLLNSGTLHGSGPR
jgi:two-component system NtrC family sensor kinase